MERPYAFAIAVLLANVHFVSAQTDAFRPINNMCMRWWHQSVIKNDVLYIDGGQESFSNYTNYTISSTGLLANGSATGPVYVGYNEYLISIPLNNTFDLNQANLTERAITKNVASGNQSVPQLVTGSLFAGPDDDNIWLYGGTTSWWNMSFPGFQWPQDQYYNLWSYNTSNQLWMEHSLSPEAPLRPSAGAHAEAPELGLAFYFNGEIDSGSSTQSQDLGSDQKIFLEGMIVVNLTDQTARNISTAAVSGLLPRSRGVLEYIPGIGEKGILVAIGGTYKNVSNHDQTDQSNFVDMTTVDIFDVASLYSTNQSAPDSAWHSQTVSGQIPGQRAQFCSVTASAPDNSSHNIYIIAGNNQVSNTFYDDVYILSLPSFTWTQVYGPGGFGRYGHTCHKVSNRHTFTVGGALSWGFNGGCDIETHGIGILDMTSITFPTVFNPNDNAYQLPGALVSAIGGSPTGGATLTSPVNGYQSLQLATIFGNPSAYRPSTTNSTSPSSSPTPSPHHTSTAAIAGGVVGGVLALALVTALAFFCLRARSRRRRRRVGAGAPGKGGDGYAQEAMMARHSHDNGTGSYLSPLGSGTGTYTHSDAGLYSDRDVDGSVVAHELRARGQELKSPVPYGVAEMEGREPIAQLPGGANDVAVELQGAEVQVDRTRGRFEMA